MYRNVLFLIAKLAALAAVGINATANVESGFFALSALAFSCLFVLQLLISRLKPSKVGGTVFILAGAGGCFLFGSAEHYPVLLILIFELIDLLAEGYFYRLAVLSVLLSYFIFTPNAETIPTTLAVCALFVFGRYLTEELEKTHAALNEERKRAVENAERTQRLEQYVKTVRESAAMEERSRFSARIHDKLGHSISGNIILLEGARLNVRSNPEMAERCIETATESLRGGVDDIRAALREERPHIHVIGATSLDEMLKGFSLKYGIKTAISAEGETRKIPQAVWHCINENLGETLTNLLKHSKATELRVTISVMNRLIRAEFSDNGACPEGIKTGIGLETIEERTLDCGGKCFFRGGINGFSTITVFPIGDKND